jgi:hypothetical protein
MATVAKRLRPGGWLVFDLAASHDVNLSLREPTTDRPKGKSIALASR